MEIQVKIEKAKADLVCMCYEFVRSYYTKMKRTKVLQILDGFKRLQGRLATRHELGRKEVLRESRREMTDAVTSSSSSERDSESESEDGRVVGRRKANSDATAYDGSESERQARYLKRGSVGGGGGQNQQQQQKGKKNGSLLPINEEPELGPKSPLLSSRNPTKKTKSGGKNESDGKRKGKGESLSVPETQLENTFYDSEYFRAVSDKKTKDLVARKYSKYRSQLTFGNAYDFIARRLPILRWFPLYYLPWTLLQQEKDKKKGRKRRRGGGGRGGGGGVNDGDGDYLEEEQDHHEEEEKGLLYVLGNLRSDVLAAITVGFMLIPQVDHLSCN